MTRYEIEFAPDGPIASHLLNTSPTRTRAGTITLQLAFDTRWPGYGNYYGTNGTAEYNAMLEHLEFTDTVTVDQSLTGVPRVSEEFPTRAPISTQIFEVTPGSDVVDLEAFWGIITAGTDNSKPPDGVRQVSLEMAFLADAGEYADRTALENDLGAVTL